jgi:hypothetical protein
MASDDTLRPDMTLAEFQRMVTEWANPIFGADLRREIKHLRREANKELSWHGKKAKDIPEESADILLMLLHIASTHGFDLMGEAIKKFKVCLDREWGEPDAEGVIEHVRTP